MKKLNMQILLHNFVRNKCELKVGLTWACKGFTILHMGRDVVLCTQQFYKRKVVANPLVLVYDNYLTNRKDFNFISAVNKFG